MSVSARSALRGASSAVLLLTLAACGSAPDSPGAPSAHHKAPSASAMPNMDAMPPMGGTGDGLSAERDGYRMVPTDRQLPSARPASYHFRVTGPDGRTVTDFAVEQTQRMHFYAIRSDLTGFRHVHPVMTADGTWTAPLTGLAPGAWRLFASFVPGAGPGEGDDFVLSSTATVPGITTPVPLPAIARSTTIDGYAVAVRGELTAGTAHMLTVTVTRGGRPVTDLEPYLGTYAHLTAFHSGDLAFAHLHPAQSAGSGPELGFHAELPKPGDWRLFLQFRAEGRLHTAELTLHAE